MKSNWFTTAIAVFTFQHRRRNTSFVAQHEIAVAGARATMIAEGNIGVWQ